MRKPLRLPTDDEQNLLDQVQVRLVERPELPRFQQLLQQHHYLGSLKPVGERLYYVATDAHGHWLALLLFSAPAKHLKHRDRWIGWTDPQRHRRLRLVTNNSRFLLLPGTVPNLGTKVLRQTLARLPDDWQARYGHPVLMVETFVDPEQFCGTVYSANGWIELGPTDGWGRCRRDYYVKHDRPKRLFVRELHRRARRNLQAEQLRPALALVEAQVPPRCARPVRELRSIRAHFQALIDHRARVESYPLCSLLTIILLAMLCGAPRGQKELAKFARGLSQAQRRAMGIRRNRQGRYPAPTQPTFCRLLQRVDARQVETAVLAIQTQLRGAPAPTELIALDGKEPKHGSGASVLTAVSVPSQQYLGSAVVDQKTNEIPVARELFARLDLAGRLVALDALHTQTETAQALVSEQGADYLFTVKDNQPRLRQHIEKLIPAPAAGFSPCPAHAEPSPHGGDQQRTTGEPEHSHHHRRRRIPLLSLRGPSGATAPPEHRSHGRDGGADHQCRAPTTRRRQLAATQSAGLGDRKRAAPETRRVPQRRSLPSPRWQWDVGAGDDAPLEHQPVHAMADCSTAPSVSHNDRLSGGDGRRTAPRGLAVGPESAPEPRRAFMNWRWKFVTLDNLILQFNGTAAGRALIAA